MKLNQMTFTETLGSSGKIYGKSEINLLFLKNTSATFDSVGLPLFNHSLVQHPSHMADRLQKGC